MKYRCQVKMIDLRQVDIEVSLDVPLGELKSLIAEQAKKEFGDCDSVEVDEVENLEPYPYQTGWMARRDPNHPDYDALSDPKNQVILKS
jgi:hypothetical protein